MISGLAASNQKAALEFDMESQIKYLYLVHFWNNKHKEIALRLKEGAHISGWNRELSNRFGGYVISE